MTLSTLRIAVLVPCFNEEAAVATVVADFRKVLPAATVYVYDNNSKDRTAAVAREAGAVVRAERRQGKGHVVRRMFADIQADIYVIVDGDGTYEAAAAPRLVDTLAAFIYQGMFSPTEMRQAVTMALMKVDETRPPAPMTTACEPGVSLGWTRLITR